MQLYDGATAPTMHLVVSPGFHTRSDELFASVCNIYVMSYIYFWQSAIAIDCGWRLRSIAITIAIAANIDASVAIAIQLDCDCDCSPNNRLRSTIATVFAIA